MCNKIFCRSNDSSEASGSNFLPQNFDQALQPEAEEEEKEEG